MARNGRRIAPFRALELARSTIDVGDRQWHARIDPAQTRSQRVRERTPSKSYRSVGQWVERLLTKGTSELAIELSGVSYVTSAILRSLLSMAKRVRARGGTLCILNPSAEIQETFGIIGFREIFESYGGRFRLSLPAAPKPERAPAEIAQLDILLGNKVLACTDGDTLGTEGSLGPELFTDLPGVAARPVLFQNAGNHWIAISATGWGIYRSRGQSGHCARSTGNS